MEIIKERLGANTVLKHIIDNGEPNSPRSYASYLLLVDYYKSQDDDYNDNWHYYFIVRRHTLRRRKRENGGKHWNCHYCGKPVKKMQKRNTQKQEKGCITIDHVIPVSSGYPKLDSNNMVESCQKCNGDKASMSYEDYTHKIMKEYVVEIKLWDLPTKVRFCAKNNKEAAKILDCSLYRIKEYGTSENIDKPYDQITAMANNPKAIGILGETELLYSDAIKKVDCYKEKDIKMSISGYNEIKEFVNDLAKRLFKEKLIYYIEYTVHEKHMEREIIYCTEYFVVKNQHGYEIIFYFENSIEQRLSFTNWTHTGLSLNNLKPYIENGDNFVFWGGEFAIPVYTFKSDDEYINYLY